MRTPRRLTLRLLPAAALTVGLLASAGPAAAQTVDAIYWNGSVPGQPPVRPGTMENDVAGEPPARVADLQWTEWGGPIAQGTGNLYVFRPGSSAIRVHVTLDRQVNCHGWQVYTAWTLTLPPGTRVPRGFNAVRIRRAPCDPGPCRLLRTTCAFEGEVRSLAHYDPRLLGASSRFFDLRWRSTGATATGTGFIRRARRFDAPAGSGAWVYPVKIRLADLRWCGSRIVHSQATFTTYGRGARAGRRARPPAAVERRLRRAIDRAGTARHTGTYDASRCEPSRSAPPG